MGQAFWALGVRMAQDPLLCVGRSSWKEGRRGYGLGVTGASLPSSAHLVIPGMLFLPDLREEPGLTPPLRQWRVGVYFLQVSRFVELVKDLIRTGVEASLGAAFLWGQGFRSGLGLPVCQGSGSWRETFSPGRHLTIGLT